MGIRLLKLGNPKAREEFRNQDLIDKKDLIHSLLLDHKSGHRGKARSRFLTFSPGLELIFRDSFLLSTSDEHSISVCKVGQDEMREALGTLLKRKRKLSPKSWHVVQGISAANF